jgi:dipeptidyl aminopeptidase/acylaminoacyl peptidase
VAEGTVDAGVKVASTIELQGSSAITGNGFLTTPIVVADGAKAKLTTVNRATTSLSLTGNGQITIYCATEKGSNYYATRTPIALNLSKFQGTLVAEATYAEDGRLTFDTSSGGDGWAYSFETEKGCYMYFNSKDQLSGHYEDVIQTIAQFLKNHPLRP